MLWHLLLLSIQLLLPLKGHLAWLSWYIIILWLQRYGFIELVILEVYLYQCWVLQLYMCVYTDVDVYRLWNMWTSLLATLLSTWRLRRLLTELRKVLRELTITGSEVCEDFLLILASMLVRRATVTIGYECLSLLKLLSITWL
jgi:hypothetical protein